MNTADTPVLDDASPVSFWAALAGDEEITNDLRALGVPVSDGPTPAEQDQAQRDTLASVLMRRQAETLAAIEGLERSCAAEVQWVHGRYAPELAALRGRVTQLDTVVRAIAAQTKDAGGYTAKKKSRDVGAGTYGYKTYAESLEISDDAAYVAWAETNAPETLRVKPTMTLAQAMEYLGPTELASVKREIVKKGATVIADALGDKLPPGFVRVPAADEFYAKPLPAVAIPGARID